MKLPDGNVLISFSGGRTSGYMLHRILEANGDLPDRVKVLFANTGREMPGTLDFVHNIEKNWGVDITWLEYSRAPSNRYQNGKAHFQRSVGIPLRERGSRLISIFLSTCYQMYSVDPALRS